MELVSDYSFLAYKEMSSCQSFMGYIDLMIQSSYIYSARQKIDSFKGSKTEVLISVLTPTLKSMLKKLVVKFNIISGRFDHE